MCLVVENKLRPLDRYAPSKLLLANTRPHGPAAIIKDLLPNPISRKVIEDHVTSFKKRGFGAGIGEFIGLKVDSDIKETVTMKTQEVNEYSLQNPENYFYELMADPLYEADIKKFLLGTQNKRGYLITGFLTTSDASWERIWDTGSSDEVKAQIPLNAILAATGIPPDVIPPNAIDPSMNHSSSQTLNRVRKMVLGENDIIAVAYSLVKLNWLDKRVVLKEGLKAKKYESAFGDDDEEELDVSRVELDDVDLDLEDMEEEDEGQESKGHITLE